MEEGVEVVAEEEDGDEVDKASTRPQYSVIVTRPFSMGMSKQRGG